MWNCTCCIKPHISPQNGPVVGCRSMVKPLIYLLLQLLQPCQQCSGTSIMRPGKSDWKLINFIICLARSLQNHVYSPCHERPPVLGDHKIWWSLYTGFTVSCYIVLHYKTHWRYRSLALRHCNVIHIQVLVNFDYVHDKCCWFGKRWWSWYQ